MQLRAELRVHLVTLIELAARSRPLTARHQLLRLIEQRHGALNARVLLRAHGQVGQRDRRRDQSDTSDSTDLASAAAAGVATARTRETGCLLWIRRRHNAVEHKRRRGAAHGEL